MPDTFLLSRLEPLLDAGSRAVLRSEMERNVGYTHAAFWAELDKTFMGEGPISSRQSWEDLPLVTGGKLTLQAWRMYVADFRRLQHRVVDATDAEAVRLLRRKIPEKIADRVESEDTRRKKHGKMLSLGSVNGSETEIMHWICQISGVFPKSVSRGMKGEWKVDCQSEEQRRLVLACNGRMLANGQMLQVLAITNFLTSEDVITVVTEFLEEKQRNDDYRRPPRREVARVGTEASHSGSHPTDVEDSEVAAATSAPRSAAQGQQSPSNRGSATTTPTQGHQESKKGWDARRKKVLGSEKNEAQSSPKPSASSAPPPPKGKGKGGGQK